MNTNSSSGNERFDQAVADYLAKVEAGQSVDRQDLLSLYPEFSDELAEFFDDDDRLKRLAGEQVNAADEPTFDSAATASTISPARPTIRSKPRYFGDYELLSEIARGGMGVVYQARHTRLNRVVALKMIIAGELASEDDVQRFQGEAQAAARLDHPGIVPIHEIGELHGQHFYAMAFVDGQSLGDIVRSGSLHHRRAARLVQQVAEAVDYAHAHGIVHRDLKPANILIDQELVPRVTDFGLAKRMEQGSDLTRTGQILGTPGYMAPEQAAGECREVGPAADIYALGAILYCCLTGRPPFQAANVLDTLVQVLESEPSLPRTLNRSIPRPLERICMRCLERCPTDRYLSAKELAADLDRFLQDQPVLAQPPSWIERLRRFSRQSPALVAHLISLFLLLLIAQVQFFSRSSETLGYHLQISGLLATWALVSLGFYRLEDHQRIGPFVNPCWLCLDVLMLSCLLALLSTPETPPGPLLIGYPMLVVGGGMFFRVRLVVLVTIAAILSYVALIVARPFLLEPLHYHVSFLLILSAIGACVAHQVRRVRVLGEYFEARR